MKAPMFGEIPQFFMVKSWNPNPIDHRHMLLINSLMFQGYVL